MRILKQSDRAKAGALRAGKHEMIEDRAVERFRRAREAPRRAAIGVAWARIAARVVVRQHDTGAAMFGHVNHDFTQRKCRAAFVPRIASEMEASGVLVDVRNPQAFKAGIASGKTSREELTSGLQAVELQREFGTLIPHDA